MRFWDIERSDSRRFRPWKFDKDEGSGGGSRKEQKNNVNVVKFKVINLNFASNITIS